MRIPTNFPNKYGRYNHAIRYAMFFSYFRFTIHNKCHGQDSRKGGWAAVPWVTHRGSGPMRIVWRGRILIFYFKEFGECQSVCSRRILRSECQTRTLSPYCCCWPVTRCRMQNIARVWLLVSGLEWWCWELQHRTSLELCIIMCSGYKLLMLAGVLAMASVASMAIAYSIIWTSKLGKNWRNGHSGGNEALHIFGALLWRLWVLQVCMFWMGLHSLAN